MNEEWRPLEGLDMHEVSDLGRVRSWKNGRHGRRAEPRMRKLPRDGNGYRMASGIKVHRAVCLAFNGPPPFKGALVRHLDGDQLNNLATNLAWGDSRDNAQDTVRHGRSTRGERSPHAKLTSAQVAEIRDLFSLGAMRSLVAERYGVAWTTINRIYQGTGWVEGE